MVMESCSDETDPSLFLAANQMNRGIEMIVEEEDKIMLMTLNVKAARLARTRSAYLLASQYLRIASQVMDKLTMWSSYYDLALEVASFGAEMECFSAKFVKCRELVDEVLTFAVSRHDRFRAYCALIESLKAQHKLVEAFDLSLKVLKQYNISIPKNPSKLYVATSLVQLLWKIPKNLDDILRLPEMRDTEQLACMKILGISANCAYYLENGRELVLLSVCMMHLILRFGLSVYSARSLATYAAVNAFLGKYEEAFAMGRIALCLLDEMNTKETVARTLSLVFCFTNHWKLPLQTVIVPLKKAYLSGLASTEIESALVAAVNIILAHGVLGTPLDQVEELILTIQDHCHEFRQDHVSRFLAPTHQAVLNFQGQSNFPTILTGTAMDRDSFTEDAIRAENQPLLHNISFNQLKLGLHFQEWQIAEDVLPIIEGCRTSKGVEKHFTIYDFTVVAGIAYAVLWQRTGKRKYIRNFCRLLKQAKGWLSSGPEQCRAIHSFLVAEQAFFQNSGAVAIKHSYDQAIHDMRRVEMIHLQAFANERAGTVLMELGILDGVLEYFTEAQTLYARYGAKAKVDQLDEKIESMR